MNMDLQRVFSNNSSCSPSSIKAISIDSLQVIDLSRSNDSDDYDKNDVSIFQDFEMPVSSYSSKDGNQYSLILPDIAQAELALWTVALSMFFTKVWNHQRNYFFVSIFIITPIAICFTVFLSWLIIAVAIIERIFWSRKEATAYESFQRSSSPPIVRRKASSASARDSRNCEYFVEQLAPFTCRHHSSDADHQGTFNRRLYTQRSTPMW